MDPTGPLPTRTEVPDRPSARAILSMVYEQAWGLCVAYLVVGLGAEMLRRLDVPGAAEVQTFLDGLPYFAIRQSGNLEGYLRASALGSLTPFWNRLLLASITVTAILVQATIMGAFIAGLWGFARRRKSRA